MQRTSLRDLERRVEDLEDDEDDTRGMGIIDMFAQVTDESDT